MDISNRETWRPIQNILFEALTGPDDQLNARISHIRSLIDSAHWPRFLERCLVHLSVDALLTDSPRADFLLYRLLERVVDTELDPVAIGCAFACTCRITAPRYPGVVDKLLTVVKADPYMVIERWYCLCSSSCSVAKRMCISKTPASLAIQSLNHIALERILWLHKAEFPLSPDFLLPVFRKSLRFNPEQVAMTCEVIATFFPEPEHVELYAASRLLAVLTDAKEGVISALPVEQIGLWGRTCRLMLPTLMGQDMQPLAVLAGLIDAAVTGRDVVYRFLIDMRVDTRSVDKNNKSLPEIAILENPSFWFSQTKNSSPASAIACELTPFLLRRFCHLSSFMMMECACTLCCLWRSKSECFPGLAEWIHSGTVDRPELVSGYSLLEILKQAEVDVGKARILLENGASVTVTDAQGNSALHIATHLELLQLIAARELDVNLENFWGRTPLDTAIADGNAAKAAFLMQECRAVLTGFGLERLCGLMEGNRDLLRAVESSVRSVTMHKPDPNVYLELQKVKHRLAIEQSASKQKVQRMESHHEAALMAVMTETQKLEAQSSAHVAALQSIRAELAVAVDSLNIVEKQLDETANAKSQLETQLVHVEESLKKLEKVRSKRELEFKQMQADRDARECSLCMAVDWDTALNCGHCYCLTCAKETCKETCPTCRKKTNGKFIKLFNCRQ